MAIQTLEPFTPSCRRRRHFISDLAPSRRHQPNEGPGKGLSSANVPVFCPATCGFRPSPPPLNVQQPKRQSPPPPPPLPTSSLLLLFLPPPQLPLPEVRRCGRWLCRSLIARATGGGGGGRPRGDMPRERGRLARRPLLLLPRPLFPFLFPSNSLSPPNWQLAAK